MSPGCRWCWICVGPAFVEGFSTHSPLYAFPTRRFDRHFPVRIPLIGFLFPGGLASCPTGSRSADPQLAAYQLNWIAVRLDCPSCGLILGRRQLQRKVAAINAVPPVRMLSFRQPRKETICLSLFFNRNGALIRCQENRAHTDFDDSIWERAPYDQAVERAAAARPKSSRSDCSGCSGKQLSGRVSIAWRHSAAVLE